VIGWATKKPWFASVAGAALAVLAGLLLWGTPLGDSWSNASYDYLFPFATRAVTNQAVLILMDNGAFDHFRQSRSEPWDRARHTQLLNRLADDGAELVVFDAFFGELRDPRKDDAFAAALRRQKRVVLMAKQSELANIALTGVQPSLPAPKFLEACRTNWGVGWLSPDLDQIVRRQWPFPSPGPYPSLPWTVAQQLGKKLNDTPQERWVRYYGQHGSWQRLSYQYALDQPTNYYRGKIVFIGAWPETSIADAEKDEFSTPYTRWTGETSGGVEIQLTSAFNLLNDESLLRPADSLELCLFAVTGLLLGAGLCRLRWWLALTVALAFAVMVSLGAILLSYYSNYWFPWLIAAGAQMPCALGWAMFVQLRRQPEPAGEPLPKTPGYTLVHPIGEGAYGRVWLARNKRRQWRAVKVVYLEKFGNDPGPYDREFSGVQKYQPISAKHPGLLQVDFVSEKLPGYFYYVMELADSLQPGWEKEPSTYKPHDLVTSRMALPKRRLPVKECVRVGTVLCEALDFLHRHGLTHRDIKPQNIVLVNGQPKLADLGLITGIRPEHEERTLVGTPGYMPPSPERPGTVAADIYALGMVLYVLSTGRAPTLFPEVATTLVSSEEPADYWPLNQVILKACQPEPAGRYASAAVMGEALAALLPMMK